MADVIHLTQIRENPKREIYRALASGIEVVLDMLTDADLAVLTSNTCIELIIANAVQFRPSLSSSPVERRVMHSALNDLNITFAERIAKSASLERLANSSGTIDLAEVQPEVYDIGRTWRSLG